MALLANLTSFETSQNLVNIQDKKLFHSFIFTVLAIFFIGYLIYIKINSYQVEEWKRKLCKKNIFSYWGDDHQMDLGPSSKMLLFQLQTDLPT